MSVRLVSYRISAAIVFLVATGGCGSAPGTPTAVPATEAAPGQPFTSQQFDYTFSYPAGWIIKEKPGEWAEFDPLDPNRGAGIDAFAAYLDGRTLALGIGARPLPAGTTLEAWSETAQELIKAGISRGICSEGIEDEPVSIEDATLDGEAALLLQYECPQTYDHFGLVLLAVREDKGYWITWLAPQGNAAGDRAEFMRIMSTWRFTE